MLGQTLEDGSHNGIRWEAERLARTIAYIQAQACERWPRALELNALVQRVVVTADRRAAVQELVSQVGGLTVQDALAAPFLALGTHAEIADQVLACRAVGDLLLYGARRGDLRAGHRTTKARRILTRAATRR